MSTWGTVIGGGVGFALGGPLGELLGLVAELTIDSVRRKSPEQRAKESEIAFIIATVALAAKMAKADGAVCAREKEAFARLFRFDPAERANVERVFDLASRSTVGFESYARQVAGLFDKEAPAREELLDCLLHIAAADHKVTEDELAYLAEVARHLGLDDAAYQAIRASHLGAAEDDPYAILGVARGADPETIKRAWRELARAQHPDALTGQGMPAEFVALAEKRLAKINAAYEALKAKA
jgi:DnaJ like chaperone protein